MVRRVTRAHLILLCLVVGWSLAPQHSTGNENGEAKTLYRFDPKIIGKEPTYENDVLVRVRSSIELRPIVFLEMESGNISYARLHYPYSGDGAEAFETLRKAFAKDEIVSQRTSNGTVFRNENEHWVGTLLIEEKVLQFSFHPMVPEKLKTSPTER